MCFYPGLRRFLVLALLPAAKAFPASIGKPAAIDGERVSVDEAATRRIRKKQYGLGDIVRRGKAPHRHPALDIGIDIVACGSRRIVHRCLDPAGADGIDAYALAAPLGGQGARESD